MRIERIGPSRYRLDLPYWDKRRKRATHLRRTVVGTRADAFRTAGEMERQVSGSLTVWTLKDALDYWRAHHDTASCLSYLHILEELAGTLRIGVPLRDWWDGYLEWLRQNRAPGTVNKYASMLRAILRYAERTGKIPEVPIRVWGIMRAPARDVVLDETQTAKLLNTVDREAPHLSAIVRYALAVPCRRGELVEMKREHLDLIGGRIRVPGANSKSGAGMWKPIPPDQVEYFRTLPADTAYLFYRRDRDGVARPLGEFKRSWRRCLRLAGLTDFRFHDLRHISATAMIDAGTPTEVVNTVAGWRTDMLRRYYHRDPAKSLELVKWPGHSSGPSSEVAELVDKQAVNGGGSAHYECVALPTELRWPDAQIYKQNHDTAISGRHSSKPSTKNHSRIIAPRDTKSLGRMGDCLSAPFVFKKVA